MSALKTQVGGNHYSSMTIQPMEFSMANGLDACQHTAIKYISRFRSKDGIRDLRKAIHVIEMLIEFEEQRIADEVQAKEDAEMMDSLGEQTVTVQQVQTGLINDKPIQFGCPGTVGGEHVWVPVGHESRCCRVCYLVTNLSHVPGQEAT